MYFAVRSVLLLLLGSAGFLTIRLAVAEAQFRLDPMLDPGAARHSLLWVRAGNFARYESSPGQQRAAVTLNPRLSSAWIALGLDAETNGNLAEAEQDLLQAARVDRLYLPAWTLANFYFRRADSERFWPWARRAATLTFDDYRPLLRLADVLETSPREVTTRLAGGPPLLRAYLDLLISSGRLDAAREVAGLLAGFHDSVDRDRLAAFGQRSLPLP